MKRFSYIIPVLLLMGIASCKKGYLDLQNPNAISPDNFPTSLSQLNLELTGAYAYQHSFGLWGHDMLGKNSYCYDHTEDMSWTGFQYWNDQCQDNAKPDNQYVYETWRDSWKGVQQCNTFLADLQAFKAHYALPSDADRLRQMEGEANFLRSFFYYYLINFYGASFIHNGQGGDQPGVPIISKVATDLASSHVARNTVSEVWKMIIDSLQAAATQLQDVASWTGADISRVNLWSVKAFLGKAYVYTEDWADAKTTLKDVIDNSGKSLVDFNTYKNMFNGSNKFNKESLFEVSMDVDKTTWGAWGESTGSSIGMVIAPCFLDPGNGNTDGSGWSNVFVHDKNLRRFGFQQPVYTLMNNPAYDSTKPGGVYNQKQIIDPAYVATSKTNRDNKTVDPRLYIGALQPYLDSMQVSGVMTPIVQYQTPPPNSYAWSLKKYVNLTGTEYDLNVNNGSDFYFLRMADIYLLYAEACVHTNDNVTALEYINKVHRRAYGYAPDSPSPVDYASLTSATKAGDAVLGNDPLKYERYAELFGEGSWWFDVCRWKIGQDEADYYQKMASGNIMWSEKRSYAQPIPTKEIQTNPTINQNPGY
jgi:hypothetical protein